MQPAIVRAEKANRLSMLLDRYAAVLLLALFTVFLSLASPAFLTSRNLSAITRQASVIGLIALGETFVILLGEIDLSVGSVLALVNVIFSQLLAGGFPIGGSIAASVLFGTLFGACTGLLVVKLKAPSFLVSLGMLSIGRGLALALTEGTPIRGLPEPIRVLGSGSLLGIPNPIWVLLPVAVMAMVVIGKTKVGRHIYAIGGNRRAAFYCGINPDRYVILTFTISGFCTALASIVFTARVYSGLALAGMGYELQVISAVIIGGASLFGGRGTVLGTLVGLLILGEITNSIILLDISGYYTQIFYGSVVTLAVVIEYFRRRMSAKGLTR